MMEMAPMTPRRPYLLRAHYEWLLDNDMTPHLVVDVTLPAVNVPMEFARDGQIVLNVALVQWVTLKLPMKKCDSMHDLVAYLARYMCQWLPSWRCMLAKMARA